MPSLRLRLASIWLPEWELRSGLDKVSSETMEALFSLLKDKAPASAASLRPLLGPLSGTIGHRRAVMASNHSLLVDALVKAIGEEETASLGREALFRVGVKLGGQSRASLEVGEGIDDLIRAARVLYRILGIRFTIQQRGKEYGMEVRRCALSRHYSEMTCRVLCAADEGVIRGLNNSIGMRFDKMITAGFPTCTARIWVEPGGPTV